MFENQERRVVQKLSLKLIAKNVRTMSTTGIENYIIFARK